MEDEKGRAHAIKMKLDAMAIELYTAAVMAGKLSLELQELRAGKSTHELVQIADWCSAQADALKTRSEAIAEANPL